MEETLVGQFYIGHRIELLNYAKMYLRKTGYMRSSQEEAEDIVQTMFLRLLESKSPIMPASLHSLSYKIINNLVADRCRHRKRIRQHEEYATANNSDSTTDAFSIYSAKDTEELIERHISQLDVCSAMIIRMNIIGGMKVSEIAEEMHIKYKTVENRLYTARKDIRRYMSKVGF